MGTAAALTTQDNADTMTKDGEASRPDGRVLHEDGPALNEVGRTPCAPTIRAAYAYCKAITVGHYENFPVASILLPRRLRGAVMAIYAFARTADDFADEAQFEGVRLTRLDEWQKMLEDHHPTHPIFIALQDARSRHKIPKQLLIDLVTAFKMDCAKSRYEKFDEILFYCRHSANPVGRLMLSLFGEDSPENLRLSDFICTALQITNFWQDVAVDLKKNRIYLPAEDLKKFGVSEADLFSQQNKDAFKNLLKFQVDRAEDYFNRGRELGLRLSGRLGIEIRLTVLTGMTILKKLRAVDFDVFNNRPKLEKKDFIKLMWPAIAKKNYACFKI